jgi:succinyl-CoA synthetase beta subunit
LQGEKLLQGVRGTKAADMDALIEVIYDIAKLAESLKADLESLEINPLRVDGAQIEALDAVITWQ